MALFVCSHVWMFNVSYWWLCKLQWFKMNNVSHMQEIFQLKNSIYLRSSPMAIPSEISAENRDQRRELLEICFANETFIYSILFIDEPIRPTTNTNRRCFQFWSRINVPSLTHDINGHFIYLFSFISRNSNGNLWPWRIFSENSHTAYIRHLIPMSRYRYQYQHVTNNFVFYTMSTNEIPCNKKQATYMLTNSCTLKS